MQIVALDFLTLSRPVDRYQNILVMTDLFTKFAWAVPTLDQTALTTARVLWKYVIQPFGCPEVLHSDQGANFESRLVHELCQVYGCRKSRTTPYHPMGNGACERLNQTVLNLLGTLEVEKHQRWAEYLPGLIQAYNNTVHASTGYAPAFLMFGRHMRTPVDLLSGGMRVQVPMDTTDWVAKHQEQLAYAYKRTFDCLKQAGQKSKRLYDRSAKEVPLLPGERVLVRDHRRRQAGKLSDCWEKRPFVIVCRLHPERPVYKIRPEGKDGPERVIHRNNLRPCLYYTAPEATTAPSSEPPASMWGLLLPVGEVVEEGPVPPPEPRRSQRANLGARPQRYLN
ncbi:unnamed protein product [Knipowitschia caucasica]